MNIQKRKKQGGIGLLELMLSLAIIAVLLVMATRYYESAKLGERLNNLVSIVQAMRGASAQYTVGQPDATFQLSDLYNAGLVPTSVAGTGGTGTGVGPWGGNLTVTGSSGNLTVELGSSKINQKMCKKMVIPRFDTHANNVVCGAGSITVTFDDATNP